MSRTFSWSFTLALSLLCAVLQTLPACSRHGEAETPTNDLPRREPAWISGQIMGVDRIPIDEYNESTVHLIITTEGDENVRVKLGPGWYMDEKGLSFKPQQHIQFRGQPDPSDGSYVAHQLRQGQQTVELRDPNGNPVWPNKVPESAPSTTESITAPPSSPAETQTPQ